MNRIVLGLVMVVMVVMVVMGLAPLADAARTAPPKVPPIVHNGVEYRADRENIGCVEAWVARGRRFGVEGPLVPMWNRQIYVIKRDVDLEWDVQDVFIKKMERDGNALVIENERGSEYRLNLDTLEVTVIRGRTVEQF